MSNWKDKYKYPTWNKHTNEELAAALEAVRGQICVYAGDTCDCKYGIRPSDFKWLPHQSSGQTGCPELREIIHRLLNGNV